MQNHSAELSRTNGLGLVANRKVRGIIEILSERKFLLLLQDYTTVS